MMNYCGAEKHSTDSVKLRCREYEQFANSDANQFGLLVAIEKHSNTLMEIRNVTRRQ
jgi:hypothetical protein